MDREQILRDLNTEVESLIRLHQKGLYRSQGYQDRKGQIKELIRTYKIDIRHELDPISLLLYQRYIE